MDDYGGKFDPEFHPAKLSRRGLAVLGREYMLICHLQDRSGLPQVMGRFGADEMRLIAIDEWMAASPTYTKRMQRALGFPGEDVATIFKGIQFDVGAPHQFLDFQMRVTDANHGEFWLAHCGALMDVEPMGEEHVRGMCHQIEDPTFDATAVATNPRARMRPIHRPPRVPADRMPHCHWNVTIEPENEPVEEIDLARVVRRSRLASLEIPETASTEPGGLSDYSGPFDPGMQLEDLAHPALVRVGQEFCLQGHLLVRALMLAVAQRHGDEAAIPIAASQWVGIAGVGAERIVRAMKIGGDGPEAIAKLLQIHSAFMPRAYIDLHVALDGDTVRCWIGDCEAFAEKDPYSWLALPEGDLHRAVEAMARVVNPRARVRGCSVPGARVAWEVEIDPDAQPSREPPEVKLTKFSSGAAFQFAERRPLRV
ncbi:MAG: hypothetical protein FJ144_11575 [Deltaproteobacteria bacterium]|nr:hypothetical protein [Deltaproteobacteria bacterium]